MYRELFEDIKKYDKIIIQRHQYPDLDALGSQLGLKRTLEANFPEKEIYAVGDTAGRYAFIGDMDELDDNAGDGALVIVCDIAVDKMISKDFHHKGDKVYVIDHHKNDCDFEATFYCDSERIAVAELIADFLISNDLTVPADAATAFIGGMITDSGRFMYEGTNANTFLVSSKLLEAGADLHFIYSNIYIETLESKMMRNYFSSKFEFTKNKVAYLKNKKDVFDKYDVTFSTISRGMINLMAGVQGVNIWVSFTYNPENGTIVGEFRARDIKIVDIAKKYGGGGHDQACGATIKDWDEVDKVIADFDKRLEEFNNGTYIKQD